VEFDLSRLRRGELIVGGAAVVLIASMLALPWYGVKGQLAPTAASLGRQTSWDGWTGLSHLRWLVLVTVLVSFALVAVQASRRAPALPVTVSVTVTVLGLVTTLALVYRVVINTPGAASLVERKAGGFVGIAAAIAVFYGGYASMREEGLSERDARTDIETVELPRTGVQEPTPNS
jgi:hypothetical protein